MEASLPQTMLQKLLNLLKLESSRPHQEIAIQSIIQNQKDAVICTHIDYHNQHESAALYWSISYDLLGADICGELPELSETDAERSTGIPLLSAAESTLYYVRDVFLPPFGDILLRK